MRSVIWRSPPGRCSKRETSHCPRGPRRVWEGPLFRRAAAARSLLSCTTGGGGRRFRIRRRAHPHLCDWRRHAANRDSSAALCLRLAPGARGKSVSRGRRGIGVSRQAGVAARFPALPLIVAQVRERPEQSPNQKAPGLAAARRPPETEAFPRARPISCPSAASAATMFLNL